MKKLLTPSTPPATTLPDFTGRARRLNLDQIIALKGYGKLKIRPIRLDDEEEMIRFHAELSEESIYLRYFEYMGLEERTAHERLVQICTNTPDSYAIVIERPTTEHRPASILAVGRLCKTAEPFVATFDTLVADEKAAKLAKILLGRLIKFAHAFGFRILTSELLVADHDSLNLCRELGFTLQTLPEDGVVQVTLDL